MLVLAILPLLASVTPFGAQEKAATLKPYPIGSGFTVSFPAKPEAVPVPQMPTARCFRCVVGGGAYMAMLSTETARIDADSNDKTLAVMVGGFLSEGRVVPIRQKDVILNGWPGIEVMVQGGGLTGWLRNYRLHRQLLQITVMSAGGDLPADARQFLDSVKIPAVLGEGPQKQAGPEFKTYEIKDAGLSVLLPTEPVRTESTNTQAGHSATMIRYTSNYGNRSYSIAYLDVPPEAQESFDDDQIQQGLDMLSGEVASGLNAKVVRSKPYRSGAAIGVRYEVAMGKNGAGRIDAEYKAGRITLVMAVVLKPLYPSTEVSKFFGSIKQLPPPK